MLLNNLPNKILMLKDLTENPDMGIQLITRNKTLTDRTDITDRKILIEIRTDLHQNVLVLKQLRMV
jgi:hypothetical protein